VRAGLADKATSMPRELSGGQAQRVALLRTLATEPRLLLLDEPLSALDVTVRAEVRRELSRQLASFHGVRLLVTHDPLEAIALADRIVVLEHGRVVQSGTPAEVTARPRSRFVADLAGVNLLRGKAHGDHIKLAHGGAIAAADAGEGDVFAVIHPRAVALFLTRPEGSARNVWQGETEGIDLHGERVRVRVNGPVPLVAEVTPSAVRDLHLHAGAPVWIAVKATEVSVYPA
jgi:molybdate transport system ATP-binding protein